jgi:hypothetical protein
VLHRLPEFSKPLEQLKPGLNMKLTNITPAQIAKIKDHRSILAGQMRKITGAQNRLDDLLSQQLALQAEIRELENAAPSRENARMLSDKRSELELCGGRLGEIKPNDPAAELALSNLMNEAVQLLNEVFPPTIKDFLKPIVAAIRPFTASDRQAEKMARETEAYKALKARLYWTHTASEVIRRYDEILAGEIAWNFNPKIS